MRKKFVASTYTPTVYVKVNMILSFVWTTVVVVPGGYSNLPFASVNSRLAAGITVGFGLNSVDVRTHTVVVLVLEVDKGSGC